MLPARQELSLPRVSGSKLIMLGGLLLALSACSSDDPQSTTSQTTTLQAPVASSGQTLGFVFSTFNLDIPEFDAAACPEGLNLNYLDLLEQRGVPAREILEVGYQKAAEDLGQRKGAQVEQKAFEYLRQQDLGMTMASCFEPEKAPETEFKTLIGRSIVSGNVPGMNLDDEMSAIEKPKACPHDDFVGADGSEGIDNQMWRVLGCVRGYQREEVFDVGMDHAVRDGSLSILMEVSGVDDELNDDDVRVRLFSASSPVPYDRAGNVISNGSMSVHDDPRFHSDSFPGRIVDGELIAGPVADVRFRLAIQVVDHEYYFRDVKLRVNLSLQQDSEGMLAGYWDVESYYTMFNRHPRAEMGAVTMGYTCPGIYSAIHRLADGHPDPETGACTSLSTAFQFRIKPAFVIHRAINHAAASIQNQNKN